jgi:hypothetical protein
LFGEFGGPKGFFYTGWEVMTAGFIIALRDDKSTFYHPV